MTPFEIPNDWFVENDGQRLVLDPEKVKAAFEARVALQGWQEISTAPKDGTQVLIADNGVWMTAARNWPCNGYWVEDVASGLRLNDPTHWMSLPQPPAASEVEERK